MATAMLRVGTRASRLALAQAGTAADALAAAIGPADLISISTRGDAISARQPSAGWVETDGQFTRELERALLEGRVDLVVHSFKDLPTAPSEGLVIGAVLERGDARDCLVTADGGTLEALPFGAWVGTSSPRRAAQLAAARSDLIATPIRGNVETRLRRLQRRRVRRAHPRRGRARSARHRSSGSRSAVFRPHAAGAGPGRARPPGAIG